MNEPRVYQHSAWNWLAVIFLLLTMAAGIYGMLLSGQQIPALLFTGLFTILVLVFVFSLTTKTIISEDEISSQNIFGTKTLRWNEIARVSGSGFAIKLYNLDNDVTVSPSVQLPKYEEVVEWIGVKRPDLFNPQEYSELPRNWGGLIPLVVVAFLVIGFGVFVYIDSNEFIFPLIFAFIIGLVILGMVFLSPQSVSIEGNSIVIGYLFNQKTFRADEIASVTLGYTQTRNGKNYYVQIAQKRGGNIRISNVKPNLPVAYHVLKNWHKKNAGIRQTIGCN